MNAPINSFITFHHLSEDDYRMYSITVAIKSRTKIYIFIDVFARRTEHSQTKKKNEKNGENNEYLWLFHSFQLSLWIVEVVRKS